MVTDKHYSCLSRGIITYSLIRLSIQILQQYPVCCNTAKRRGISLYISALRSIQNLNCVKPTPIFILVYVKLQSAQHWFTEHYSFPLTSGQVTVSQVVIISSHVFSGQMFKWDYCAYQLQFDSRMEVTSLLIQIKAISEELSTGTIAIDGCWAGCQRGQALHTLLTLSMM